VQPRSATQVLEAIVAIFASGDASEASHIVAEDYFDHQGLGDEPIRGVDGFAHVVRTNYGAYEHQEITIEDIFGSGDRAVARIRWRGRRRGGEKIDRETIEIVRIVGGRAIEHWGTQT
jgi:predicted SnoaL-like aldol condensation-catalyzing enzyme